LTLLEPKLHYLLLLFKATYLISNITISLSIGDINSPDNITQYRNVGLKTVQFTFQFGSKIDGTASSQISKRIVEV